MVLQTQKNRPPKQISQVFITGIITLMSLSALLWILNSQGIIQGTWSTIFNIIFTVLGAILGLLQWHTQTYTTPAIPSPLQPTPPDITTNNKQTWEIEIRLNDDKGTLIISIYWQVENLF